MREVISLARLGILAAGGLVFAVPPAAAQASAAPAASNSARALATFVGEAARRFGIPESWIHAVMRAESGGDPRALSPKGAAGVMQLMPATWHDLRARYGLGDDVWDPRDNILAGAGYLRELYDRYGSPGYLAAYNAGPLRYEDYLRKGRALPVETTAYVGRIVPRIDGAAAAAPIVYRPDPNAWMGANLFTAGPGDDADPSPAPLLVTPKPASVKTAGRPVHPSLFIPLSGRSAP